MQNWEIICNICEGQAVINFFYINKKKTEKNLFKKARNKCHCTEQELSVEMGHSQDKNLKWQINTEREV